MKKFPERSRAKWRLFSKRNVSNSENVSRAMFWRTTNRLMIHLVEADRVAKEQRESSLLLGLEPATTLFARFPRANANSPLHKPSQTASHRTIVFSVLLERSRSSRATSPTHLPLQALPICLFQPTLGVPS